MSELYGGKYLEFSSTATLPETHPDLIEHALIRDSAELGLSLCAIALSEEFTGAILISAEAFTASGKALFW